MWILVLLILLMPFETNPYLYLSSSFLGVFPDFTAIKLVGIVGLAWTFLKIASSGIRIRVLGSRQAVYFFYFLFIVLIAGLLNGVVMRPVSRLVSIILLLPLVLTAVRTKRQLMLTLKVAAGSLVLVFPYGYRQLTRFGGRYGVGLYEPNYLAIALVLLIPLTVVFARHDTSKWRRPFWKVGAVVLLVSLVLTGSRGGFVGLVVVAIALVLKLERRRLVGFVAAGVTLAGLLFVLPNPLLERLRASRADSGDYGVQVSNEARFAELVGGFRMIRARPLTGVGLGNFKPWMARYPDLDTGLIAHNSYLEIAAELGLPALFVFLLVIVSSYRSLSRAALAARQAGSIDLHDSALALQVGILGYMTSAIFLSAQFEKYLWLVLFLTICLDRIARAQRGEASATTLDARKPAEHFQRTAYSRRFNP